MPKLTCHHFEQQRCTSCQWLNKSYAEQLVEKTEDLKRLVSPYFLQTTEFLPAVTSPLAQFRNKAKMVVTGSVERPILGILNDDGTGTDLSDCPLYPNTFSALFPILKTFIGRAGLVPYNVAKKRGELKYILITQSQYNQSLMIRFVLKSEAKRPLVERELPALLAQLPEKSVVSLNIQPQHSAILEGEQEIFLTEQQVLEEHFNGIPLFIRPQGFFQTNPLVASKLYQTAQQWIADLPIDHLWDLFCGVGGFGLHCATALRSQRPNVALTGIEISASAIASATKSAQHLGLTNVKFASLDSAQFALNEQGQTPDFVIVNPPRRGIGKPLADFINQLGSSYLIYSSCNAETMAKDFASLTNYQLVKVQLFDMFPHTTHYETLTFLSKK
ncbi:MULTISPECIES: 23S rRNA (uracil(747)-C(5))-methyltransferase RlmC [Glaesserella]|uniref:23S rRNA (uracil(747)-C(5))-methyltransferase RlmC n=1 Tax=Glaesserella australis TaxID=2094024 RepID=A0A328BW34_9PAST|nr:MULTISPECIES: 23S rRNA (uracil(747)-C(5))-methyltransferase RlmC [Glaesserella]AUI66101.1 23S rRNA (uracil(747)-C(5))-methyltransferase RlmC [Glaesserella sp. 15-184]RAL17835.1 23S rRNA (uracil(747)-C(5))-methyltransferase RlmC [Glaesserella australis]